MAAVVRPVGWIAACTRGFIEVKYWKGPAVFFVFFFSFFFSIREQDVKDFTRSILDASSCVYVYEAFFLCPSMASIDSRRLP